MTRSNPDQWIRTTIDQLAVVNPPKPKFDDLADDAAVGFLPMAAVDEVSGEVAQPEIFLHALA